MLSKQLNEQIIDTLFTQVPEFAEIANKRIDQEFIKNGYLVFGPFGTFLSNWIMNEKAEDLVNRSYYYINDLCSNSNKEIEQLLKVTFFEVLVDKKKLLVSPN